MKSAVVEFHFAEKGGFPTYFKTRLFALFLFADHVLNVENFLYISGLSSFHSHKGRNDFYNTFYSQQIVLMQAGNDSDA